MKRTFLYLLLLILPAMAFVSCSDDDDLPKVEFSVDFGNQVSDGTVYVVAGDTLTVNAVTVKNLESDKAVGLTPVTYYINGFPEAVAPVAPFAVKFPISKTATPGRYLLTLETQVLMVDKSPAFAVISYYVKVVESADDIPSEAVPTALVAKPNYDQTK